MAPGWTEAMFHELLDQEAAPAAAPALHHAADIMSLYDTAKTQHCMAGMQQSISGQSADFFLSPSMMCMNCESAVAKTRIKGCQTLCGQLRHLDHHLLGGTLSAFHSMPLPACVSVSQACSVAHSSCRDRTSQKQMHVYRLHITACEAELGLTDSFHVCMQAK